MARETAWREASADVEVLELGPAVAELAWLDDDGRGEGSILILQDEDATPHATPNLAGFYFGGKLPFALFCFKFSHRYPLILPWVIRTLATHIYYTISRELGLLHGRRRDSR